jgi:glucokinase
MADDGDRRVVAVDLGGTNIRVAVVTQNGSLTHRRGIPTGAAEGPDAVLERIVGLVREVAEVAGVPERAPVGIASPGPLDPRSGVVFFTPNLPGWRDVPLGRRVADGVRRDVFVANDGNCAALGEIAFGAAKGVDDLVYLALGTGVGGGVVSGGRLIDGVRGLGAELGHCVIATDGPRCTCGGVGCLEAFASGWAIAREGTLVATTEDGRAIRDAAAGGPINASVIARAADTGDAAAAAILERAGRALGAAIGAFVNIFNPELVAIGGGVAVLGDHLLGPARRAMTSHSFLANREDVRFAMSALGDDTGLFGAAALALGHGGGRPPVTPT